ncbi:MAG: hypothetical protein ACRDQB_09310 [Thermocrispum sp.]
METFELALAENGARMPGAVDVVALAIALDVSPNRLLLPFTAAGDVSLPGVGSVPAREMW